jgi:hypothetical protein
MPFKPLAQLMSCDPMALETRGGQGGERIVPMPNQAKAFVSVYDHNC